MGLLGRDTQDKRTRIWTRGSQTIVAFVHAAKKRRRVLAIVGAVLVVVGGIATFGVLRYLKAEAAERVKAGHGELAQCLLGEPLAEGETASMRFRAIQRGALTLSDQTRDPSKGEPWPDRCAPYAHKLAEGVAASSLIDTPEGATLRAATASLAEALEKKDAYFADLSTPIDATFDAIAGASVARGAAAEVPPPPAANETLTLADLDGAFTAKSTALNAISVLEGGTDVRLLVTDPKVDRSPFLCTVSGAAATCATVGKPAAAAPGLRLAGSADDGAEPLLFGSGEVYRGDGSLLVEAVGVEGHVAADGVATFLAADGDKLVVHRFEAGKDRGKTLRPFGLPDLDPRRDAVLVGEDVVLAGTKKDEWVLQTMRIDKGRLTAKTELGTLEGASPVNEGARVDACRAGAGDVVRVVGDGQSHLTFSLGNRWSEPVVAKPGGGRLSCHGKTALTTRVRAGAETMDTRLEVVTCGPKACEAKSLTMQELFTGELGLVPTGTTHALGVQGAVVLAWPAGQRGGLRVRRAPVGELANAPDIIAFDDLVADGAVSAISTLSDMRLLRAGDGALLLLDTTAGLRAVRVNAAGEVTPVAVTWK